MVHYANSDGISALLTRAFFTSRILSTPSDNTIIAMAWTDVTSAGTLSLYRVQRIKIKHSMQMVLVSLAVPYTDVDPAKGLTHFHEYFGHALEL